MSLGTSRPPHWGWVGVPRAPAAVMLHLIVGGWIEGRVQRLRSMMAKPGEPAENAAQALAGVLQQGLPSGSRVLVRWRDDVGVPGFSMSTEVPDRLHEEPDGSLSGITGWIETGTQRMDGETAQWYARSRYTTSDWDRMKRQRELQTAILADRAIAAFNANRYREAILFLDQLGQISTRRQDLMVLRGYAYMNLKYHAEARRIFEALAATGNRDAMQGLAAVEALIGDDGFCFGPEPGLADVYLVPQLYAARRFNVPLEAYPRILRVEKLTGEHEAFSKAHPSAQQDAE